MAAPLKDHLFREAVRAVTDLREQQLIDSTAFDYVLQVLRHEQEKPAGAPPPQYAMPVPSAPGMQPAPQGYSSYAPPPVYNQGGSYGGPPAGQYPPGQSYGAPAVMAASSYTTYSSAGPAASMPQPSKQGYPPQQMMTQQMTQHHQHNVMGTMGNLAGKVGNAATWGFGAAIGSDAGHAVFQEVSQEVHKIHF